MMMGHEFKLTMAMLQHNMFWLTTTNKPNFDSCLQQFIDLIMYPPFMREHFGTTNPEKLVPTNVNFYFWNRLVTKARNVLQFEQAPRLKTYIDLNQRKWWHAANEFFKLCLFSLSLLSLPSLWWWDNSLGFVYYLHSLW